MPGWPDREAPDPSGPHRTPRPRELAALYEFADLIGRRHGTVYQYGTKPGFPAHPRHPLPAPRPSHLMERPANRPGPGHGGGGRRRRPSARGMKRRACDYLRAAVERRSDGLLLGRQRARIPGTHLDPRGELIVGAQIVGTDAQPPRHVPATHVHKRGLRRCQQGVRLRGDRRGPWRHPRCLRRWPCLPQMRKASPPSIFFSVSSRSLPMSWRIRSASSSS